jgi:hypothetical protein
MAARGDYFRFDFYLKNNPTEIKKKPKPVQTDRFRFDYFRAKTKTETGSNRPVSVRLF